MNYYTDETVNEIKNAGKVSRYAWGRDYHNVIWEKLDLLINYTKLIQPNFEAKSYVDTGPVMDKIWAVKTGLGWQGKHSNIINKKIGSWFFIATILSNHDFDQYNKPISDFCGTCTACIDACPTDAIVEDYLVDSNKCISYLTIENKKDIQDKFLGKFDNWIFGCDICQDVCPWNIKFAEQNRISDFQNNINKLIQFEEIDNMNKEEFKERFHESPILRAKLKGLKRNANFLKKEE
jgi:epoxyqueuosine reductase